MIKPRIAVDCEWNSWSSWTTCSTTCDAGIQSRTRTKSRVESPSGICEGSANEQKSCKIKSCPCVWGDWSSWSSCSTTCDAGIESRTRTKIRVESPGGICEGSANDQKSCKIQPCPCVWGIWGSWSACSKTCGSGLQSRERSKSVVESPGGICTGSTSDHKVCKLKSCPGKYLTVHTPC